MFCKKCGNEIPENSDFCSKCGEKLTAVEPKAESVAVDPGKTLGLVAMIMGFVALGTQLIGVAAVLTLPAAVAAIICGYMGKNRSMAVGRVNANAKTGIICGFVAAIINLVMSIAAVIVTILACIFYGGMMMSIFGLAMS